MLCMMSASAWAADGNVAKVDETGQEYPTLSAAVADAKDGHFVRPFFHSFYGFLQGDGL